MWRKLLVLVFVGSLVHVPDLAVAAMGKSMPDAAVVRAQVERSEVGSYLALKLTDGRRLTGRLEAVAEKGFTVKPLQAEAQQAHVAYEQVAKLKVLKKRSYRAAGQPNPAFAKQAVEGLGVGTHVMVKILGRMLFRGDIQAIEEKSFTLQLDISGQRIPIGYDQVVQVRENSHSPFEPTIAILISAVIALLVYIAVRRPASPVPGIASVSPSSAKAGCPGFTVTVTGSSFIRRSRVRWNGENRRTQFVSGSELRAEISAEDCASESAAQVTVFNPGRGGGTSSGLTFTVK